jgi:hypothetical protein
MGLPELKHSGYALDLEGPGSIRLSPSLVLSIMKPCFRLRTRRQGHGPGRGGFERLLSLGATARICGVPFFDWLLKAFRAAKLAQLLPALEPA